MEAQHKINDFDFSTNYQPLPETSETNVTRKSLFGIGKKSFLVFSGNKYITVPTESIAFFYVKYEATVFVTFDKHQYSVNYSLEQIQQLLSEQQFYRLNRQYLVNFNAIKEVEHYFARKLLVVPTIAFYDKMVVSKEKARRFLDWLENR